MPTLSIYLRDELYTKLLASKESPSRLARRLIEEHLAKIGTQESFEILTIEFWDAGAGAFRDMHILLDKSKPKKEQYVMQSENLNDIDACIKKMKDVSNKK